MTTKIPPGGTELTIALEGEGIRLSIKCRSCWSEGGDQSRVYDLAALREKPARVGVRNCACEARLRDDKAARNGDY